MILILLKMKLVRLINENVILNHFIIFIFNEEFQIKIYDINGFNNSWNVSFTTHS